MSDLPATHLHPVEEAKALESRLRLFLQNPRKILKKYIHPGMTVLDLGCGSCNNHEDSLGLAEKVDFILAFYSFHEMRFIDNIICDLRKIAAKGTKIFISEQKFHVSKSTFDTIIKKLEEKGFEICERPAVFLSRTVVMKPGNSGKTGEQD